MNRMIKLSLLFLPPLLFIGGCSTHTRYVETSGPRTLNTTEINIQDFSYAAEDMIKSLLASGALDKAPKQPAVLASAGSSIIPPSRSIPTC